jgi:coniferyl-aldehyde dehydrogenase
MANAARNLMPVTLELGGKSPAIVAPGFPIKTAAERILWAKTFNAGQTCVAVDYAFLPRGSEDEFVGHCRRLFATRYPDINGPDFTSIIDRRSYDRLTAALEDARLKGATLVNLAEGQTPDKSKRRLPPHIILNVTPEMELMRREIFGPILPILTYGEPQEVVDAINARDRPLALYPFVRDAATRRFLIAHTRSGGVSVNEGILHVVQHDLPFGGVGPSGMGHYHGKGKPSRSSGRCSRRASCRWCRPLCSPHTRLFAPNGRPHGVDEGLTVLAGSDGGSDQACRDHAQENLANLRQLLQPRSQPRDRA